MFFHNLKYALKTTMKNKITLLWSFIFPIALGTFMYMAFGNLFQDELFDPVPVAVVTETENEAFMEVLNTLNSEGEDRVIDATYADKEEAQKLLNKEEVKVIIYVGETPRMEVLGDSYDATVIKIVLEEYEKVNKVVLDVGEKNPLAIQSAIDNLTSNVKQFTSMTTSDGNQDMYTNFFYAVFAMSCLFAALNANDKIHKLQANSSPLGMRRCLSPNSKMVTVVAEFVAMLIVNFSIELITLAYMTLLGVDFGDKYLLISVVLLFGSAIGISIGVLIGAAIKDKNKAEGICVCVTLFLSVLADLMVGGIKYAIEQKMPIINRINPAALIVDSFYALNIYDTYDRYIRNMATLGIMSVILVAIAFMKLRRNKYASL